MTTPFLIRLIDRDEKGTVTVPPNVTSIAMLAWSGGGGGIGVGTYAAVGRRFFGASPGGGGSALQEWILTAISGQTFTYDITIGVGGMGGTSRVDQKGAISV